jgi:DNA invertase Pin-like site-specific DNA recombinase
MLIGYARVSTDDQNLEPQLIALRVAGCTQIFEEHASGGSRSRPQLIQLLDRIRRGDTLIITRIDRLARSLSHLLEIVERLRGMGAFFRSLSDPIDTSGPTGFLVLQILGAVAEFERSLIRERTRAGLASARSAGRIGGNPGLRSRDPAVLAKLAASRRAGRIGDLSPGAHEWLPIVRRMRPSHRWDIVTKAVNDALPLGRRKFTKDRLVRSLTLFVQEGFAEKSLLDPAPRKHNWRQGETRNRAVEAAAALVAGDPNMTLQRIGSELKRLKHRPPRQGENWAPSSVKALLDRARGAGLLVTDYKVGKS